MSQDEDNHKLNVKLPLSADQFPFSFSFSFDRLYSKTYINIWQKLWNTCLRGILVVYNVQSLEKRLSTEWIIKEVCHTRKNSTEVLTTKVRGSFSIYYNYTYYKFDILCISLKSRHSRRYSAAKKICIDRTTVLGMLNHQFLA